MRKYFLVGLATGLTAVAVSFVVALDAPIADANHARSEGVDTRIIRADDVHRTGVEPVVLPTSGSGSELPGPRALRAVTSGAIVMMAAGTLVTIGGVGAMRFAFRVNPVLSTREL